MNSLEIKHALMAYFRFKRQWICASECLNNDVMVITDKNVIEVEVKISKFDLWKGEAKKRKHRYYKNFPEWAKNYYANRFYICVPEELLEEAKKWIVATNTKYGIIVCTERECYPYHIRIKKQAKSLHDKINTLLPEKIMRRVCSENISLIEKNLLREK